MKRKKKKQDERLGSMLNTESSHSSRRQVGAIGTITSMMMILFFTSILISKPSGFVVNSNGRMNPFTRKAIETNVGTGELARNKMIDSCIKIGEQIKIDGASSSVEKEFDRASLITRIVVGKKDLFGIHTEKEFGDDRFVQIQDELGTKFDVPNVDEKEIENTRSTSNSFNVAEDGRAGTAESSIRNVTDRSERPLHVIELEEAGHDVARDDEDELIKMGQGEANENARAREVGEYVNSTDESKSIETRNLFVILQNEMSASEQVNQDDSFQVINASCPDARLDSCDADGGIDEVAGNNTEFLESSVDKEAHVGDESATSSSFDLQITYTKLAEANYGNEAEEETSLGKRHRECLRQRWMFRYGGSVDVMVASSSDVDCVGACVGVVGDGCARVLSAGRESECASVSRALKMTACRETMTGGNRVTRSLLDGSLNVAMILLRTTISYQTFRESSSLESDESWSWSQLRLVTDSTDRATGPGSDRSSILVATVLSCDGLEMAEHTLYLTRMCLGKVMSSNDITGRVLHVIAYELKVNQNNVNRLAIKVDGWEAIYIPELCYDDATPGTVLDDTPGIYLKSTWELVSTHWVEIMLCSTLNAEQGRVSDNISQHSHCVLSCDMILSNTADHDIKGMNELHKGTIPSRCGIDDVNDLLDIVMKGTESSRGRVWLIVARHSRDDVVGMIFNRYPKLLWTGESLHNGLSSSDLIVADGISLRYGVSYCSDGCKSICLAVTGTYKFEWVNDRNEKPDTFETEVEMGQVNVMARESLSVDLLQSCAHGTLISDVRVKVWKPGEQGRCYDFEAECRTEPMNLNCLTGDVIANIKQKATGIETKAEYSGEQSESNLKHEYGEDNIFDAYANASMEWHECIAVWLAFIFVTLVLVILSGTLKCECKYNMACEDDDILEQGRVSESVLWLLSYLRHLHYDLYEVQYSLAGVQRGLVLCFYVRSGVK